MNTVLSEKAELPSRTGAAAIQRFDAMLLRRTEIAEETMGFYFTRPSEFRFEAGQAITIALVDPAETDAKGDRRTFSIASAPFERELMVASRMRDSAFKQTLRTMPLGTRVQVRGPTGTFTLAQAEQRPAVMLAGGIGITPFVSMLRHELLQRTRRPVWLFYSNRTPATAAFLPELTAVAALDPSFRVIATITDADVSRDEWSGPRGFIDREKLQGAIDNLLEPIYYVAGPPPMVKAMIDLLVFMCVPEKQIRTDEFFGY